MGLPSICKLQTKDALPPQYMEEYMKSLMLLLDSVLQDCSTHCGTTTTRDFLTISRRVENEGLSFLTISLGNFATDFERSLELGYIAPSAFPGFGKTASIPRLFSGMMRLVFNTDGKLLSQPSISAIFCIRQVCRLCKKILLPCTKERELAAVEGYAELERMMSMLDVDKAIKAYAFGAVSDIIWSQVLAEADQTVSARTHIPKHGSGATATKVLPNQKYVWTQWHERLEDYFPSDSFCYANSDHYLAESSKISYVNPDQEQPVRVVFVPKTLKTPRVIGIEPACMQYTQQSLLSLYVSLIEKHSMTSCHINFSDQTINAKLALKSSKDGLMATLDLSEASDRVHHALVARMLRTVPNLRDATFACRSTRATLPGGTTILLEKFASMGSALCFPIESMVFFTILICSELERLNLSVNARNVRLVSRSVYVYGDDIIIPVDAVPSATIALSLFGLKVNSTKSFSIGNFRESCGMDAYAGYDITPSYLRNMLPSSRRDVRSLLSAVALSNQLYFRGFYKAASAIEGIIASIRVDIPIVSESAACVGYVRDASLTVHRYNEKLHRPEVRALVPVVKRDSDVIDDRAAFMKWILKGLNPDKDHYLHSVSSGRLTVKVRWTPVF